MGFRRYIRHFVWAQFCCLSVLHCQGVFPSGSCHLNRILNRRSSRSRSSSSRRKKLLQSFFSIGFRSYIRHFLRAILMPFRPSLPGCFPIRELPFEQKEQQEQKQQQQEEKIATIIFFDWFQKLHQALFGRNFSAFPSFTAMVFSHPGAAV